MSLFFGHFFPMFDSVVEIKTGNMGRERGYDMHIGTPARNRTVDVAVK